MYCTLHLQSAHHAAPCSSTLRLSVRDDKFWQTLAVIINDINNAVAIARARPQGLVRTALHAVIVLAQLAAPVAKVLAFPDLCRLERVPAQHLDEQQVVVRAILVRFCTLDVCVPVDMARVVAMCV